MNITIDPQSSDFPRELRIDEKPIELKKNIIFLQLNQKMLNEALKQAQTSEGQPIISLEHLSPTVLCRFLLWAIKNQNPEIEKYLTSSNSILDIKKEITKRLQSFSALVPANSLAIRKSVYSRLLQKTHDEINELQAELERAEFQEEFSKFNALLDIKAKLEDSIEKKQEILQTIEPEFASRKNQFNQVSTNVNQFKAELDENKNALLSLFNQINSLNRKIAQLELEQEEYELEDDLEGLEEIQTEIKALQTQHTELQQEANALKEVVTKLENRYDTQKTKFDEVEKKLAQITSKHQENRVILESDQKNLEKINGQIQEFQENHPRIKNSELPTKLEDEKLRASGILSSILAQKRRVVQSLNKKIRDFEESREIPPGTQASHPPVAKIPKIISDASKHFQDFISPIIELLSFLESNIESLSTIEDSKTRELYVDNLLYPSQMALDWIDKEKETENTNSDRTGDLNILVLAFLVVLQLNSLLLCVLPSSGPFLDLVQDFIAIVKSNEKELQLSQKKGVLGFITDANPENITKGYQSIEQFKV